MASDPLSQDQVERIFRLYFQNLNELINRLIANVDITSLKGLRVILVEFTNRIDQALGILDGGRHGQ